MEVAQQSRLNPGAKTQEMCFKYFCYPVSGQGDVNDDWVVDLTIGASGADHTAASMQAIHVITTESRAALSYLAAGSSISRE